MKPRVFLLMLSMFIVPFAFAQDVKMGSDVTAPDSPDLAPASVRTDISLDPATATGRITSVTVYWSDATCANAFKIKFFRRNGDALTPTGAGFGPFSATSNVTTITFGPSVPAVQQGDLIGIVRVGDCGTPGALASTSSNGYLSYYGEVVTTTSVVDGQRVPAALAVSATGPATDSVGAVLPAVGSVRGLNGSAFKTSLQLLNPSSSTMTGWIVFHPHGIPAGNNGSGYGYSIPAGQQISIDLDTAFTGAATGLGLGTMDFDIPTGQGRPQIVARVYNDAGTDGTAGFYEDPISLADTGAGGRIISRGATGFMVTPVDTKRTRFNIGVRSYFSGAEIRADLLDNAGHVLASASKHYPANYFEQVDAASFFGGVPVGANKIIRIIVDDGSATVYGATTDNVTNDPAVQYALVAPVDR